MSSQAQMIKMSRYAAISCQLQPAVSVVGELLWAPIPAPLQGPHLVNPCPCMTPPMHPVSLPGMRDAP